MGSTGYLLLSMVVLAVFFIYISKSGRAFIHMDFFRNRNYVTAILLVALTFGIQNSFSFLFPSWPREYIWSRWIGIPDSAAKLCIC